MTVWRDDPERAADALVEASLDDLRLEPGAHLLLINQGGRLPRMFESAGFKVSIWNRRVSANSVATAAPDAVAADAALLRMPKAKDELVMTTHMASAAVRSGGRVFIYGGNDEGVRAVAARLSDIALSIGTVATRQHGRIIAFDRPGAPMLKADAAAWKQTDTDGWVSYPGLFARGAKDDGTALLVGHLPRVPSAARVLDYGCGPGAISAAIVAQASDVVIDAVDNDTVALLAVRDNVRCATPILGFDLSAVASRRYDLIVSNPPIHEGVREDHGVLTRLIKEGAALLTANGTMALVVQKRVPLEAMLKAAFADVSIAADDGRFRVWYAGRAKPAGR